MIRGTDTLIIDDLTPIEHPALNLVSSAGVVLPAFGRGLIPRDYSEPRPPGLMAPPSSMTVIPMSEWSERIRDKEATKSNLSDMKTFPALDQNGQGFCWFYSGTSAVMMIRAKSNQPYVRLSAHAGACKIKNFRNEGGWCGLGAEFIIKNGIPSVDFWPEKSMARTHDNERTWDNAKLHRVTEDWIDIDASIYDRNLTEQQRGSCLLRNDPCPTDRNWWGHSTCDIDLVDGTASFNAGMLRHPGSAKLLTLREFDIRWATDVTGGYGYRTLNSWTESWGTNGMGVLAGTRGRANSCVCLLVTGGSVT